ncbi:ribosomal protein L21 [Bacillus fengqiuensis]|nr:ribosomal protein L21 [Bacillus fengqiuensis]
MKKSILPALIGLMAILSGCGEQEAQTEPEVKIVEVEILADEKGEVNETMPIEAKVTYGDELVEDAEVTFELINGEKKERIAAKGEGKGIYHIDKTFTEEGTYEVIAHTNAKSMHTMPKMHIQVGDKVTVNTDAGEMDHKEMDMEESSHEH